MDEPIPICPSERVELATHAVGVTIYPGQKRPATVGEILSSIDRGRFKLMDHRVVVLKDR